MIEDFLSPDECKYFFDIVDKNSTKDVKPGYRGLGLIHKQNLAENHYPTHLDPDQILMSIVDKVEEYYRSNYEMYGTFEFNRIFGNVMEEGATHPSHKDEEPGPSGEFDGKMRSHVCSILLNDDYEGGELIFNELRQELKPKPGSLVLFPGYYVTHGVNKIKKGTRINLLVFFYDILP